jgi:hypothetical protein
VPETSNPDPSGKVKPPVTLPSGETTPDEPAQPPPSASEQVPRSGMPSGVSLSSGSPPSQGAELAKITGGVLAGLASQAVILTAVLFYFGWVRARATYGYFGVDISVLNFSASDYVLRSVDAAFPLLVAIGLAGLVAMVVHEQVRPGLVSDAENANRLARGVVRTGAGLVMAGLVLALVLRKTGVPYFFGPGVVLLGSAVTAYGFAIRNRYGTQDGSRLLVTITAMTLVAFLWTVTAYANYVGIQVAKEVSSGLSSAPGVAVYSSTDLSLSGPGIKVGGIPGRNTEYRFRYSGLRILISSAGHYFLLPSGWRQGHGPVIVLPNTDSENIRMEFTVSTP